MGLGGQASTYALIHASEPDDLQLLYTRPSAQTCPPKLLAHFELGVLAILRLTGGL